MNNRVEIEGFTCAGCGGRDAVQLQAGNLQWFPNIASQHAGLGRFIR